MITAVQNRFPAIAPKFGEKTGWEANPFAPWYESAIAKQKANRADIVTLSLPSEVDPDQSGTKALENVINRADASAEEKEAIRALVERITQAVASAEATKSGLKSAGSSFFP